ncbi:MAG: site-specific DNA-methyltransferase [Firmicutes bacterium]|nr:site-specific DNA-methyltransferase [Bacillota bacterium]
MKDSILKNKKLIKVNHKNKIDGVELLKNINDEKISVAFFDPQYRGILDKMKYGNEGVNRGKARSDLMQMDEDTIITFIEQIDRVLKKSGHLFLWVDKFHLCSGTSKWFKNTSLQLVDMIVWDKGKIGMGYRSRRKSEYIIVFQKEPVRAKDCWTKHNIPDVWEEKIEKKHPHSKPIQLQRELISATTKENEYVVDPAAGGYSVFEACKLENRNFIGGDIEYGED